MYGSEAAAQFAWERTKDVTEVAAAVGTRIRNLAAVPQGLVFPAAIHYMESGVYSGPVFGHPNAEELRYVYRFICKGESTDPIRPAALAMFDALSGASGSVVVAGVPWHVSFMAFGEWPLTTVIEGNTMYRQIGNYFTVEVMAQGE
jgi:hypothetical protein